MNKIKKYGPLAACCFWALAAVSCIQEGDGMAADSGTATLTVKYGTRAEGEVAVAVKQEGIHTLRLILVQEDKVASNYKATFGTDANNPLEEQVVRFLKFPKKATTIYAIANEEGVEQTAGALGLDSYAEGTAFGETQKNELLDKVIDNSNRKFFPKTQEALVQAGKYLPMTGIATCDMNEEEEHVDVLLKRMVAKLKIKLVNKTGADLPINQIRFGNFFADRSYLFDKSNVLPDGITYAGDNYIQTPTGTSISAGGEGTFIDYVCESAAGTGAYQLGLNDLTDFPLKNILSKEGQPFEAIYRNTCVDITATAHPTGWDLTCTASPWDVEENEVDYKTQLSWTAGAWKETTIFSQTGNNVYLRTDQPAEMTFTIATPEGAEWTAELTNSTDFRIVEGFANGKVVYDASGKPVAQTIKVEVVNPDAQEALSTSLKVFAIIGGDSGNSYELNVTKAGAADGSADENVERFILWQTK